MKTSKVKYSKSLPFTEEQHTNFQREVKTNSMFITPSKETMTIMGCKATEGYYDRENVTLAFNHNSIFTTRNKTNWHPTMIAIEFKTLESIEAMEYALSIIRRDLTKTINEREGEK